nr:MAG TPA: hypothetical protein [Caudoviricetes sp.]
MDSLPFAIYFPLSADFLLSLRFAHSKMIPGGV